MDVGQRIRKYRKALNIRIVDLANQIGISHPYLSQIERGERPCPLDVLEKACDVFGITLADFFSSDAEDIPPDMLQLIETAKKLTPEERRKLNELLQMFLERG